MSIADLISLNTHGMKALREGYNTGWRYAEAYLKKLKEDKALAFYSAFIFLIFLLAVIGPYVAPYRHNENLYYEGGDLMRYAAPSLNHPLGTNDKGYDIFSRIIIGARVTVIIGFLGGGIIISIGLTIGLLSGYFGGKLDDILMRLTDFAYGIPLIPTAIVLLALWGLGFFSAILVVGIILWRSSARVLRSQVLQVKNRPFVTAARSTGASDFHILTVHILPNIAPMAVLMFALGIGYAILAMAGLAFIGVVNPFLPSWGMMIRNAYQSGLMGHVVWWSIPPGVMISMTVLSCFMIGRKLVKEEKNEVIAETNLGE